MPMKRLLRWAFNLCAAVSAVLCVGRNHPREPGDGKDWITINNVGADVPYGFVVLPLAAAPAWWLLRWMRRRRRRVPGLCPGCGYDLRATPERCPECGQVPIAVPEKKGVTA